MGEVSRVVVIGASAGGLEPLVNITRDLPAGLDAAVFVVLHTSPRSPGLLPQILTQSGRLPAAYASEGETIRPSRIYIARPDMHMLLTPESIRLSHGAKENGFRPAVDPLFRSAADAFEADSIGVVLSGGLSDGAAGLRAIKRSGGFAIVQDPNEAPFFSMPASALELGPVDFSLPASEIGPTIVDLVSNRQRPAVPPGDPEIPGFTVEAQTPPSSFTCPECHGALWEVKGKSPQFRCRVGHSFSASRLMEMQDDGVERALFARIAIHGGERFSCPPDGRGGRSEEPVGGRQVFPGARPGAGAPRGSVAPGAARQAASGGQAEAESSGEARP